MPGLLTKQARIDAARTYSDQLTTPYEQHSKMIFDRQVEDAFNFHSVQNKDGRELPGYKLIAMYKAFGNFMDDVKNLSITEVEAKYERRKDVADATYDPETKSPAEIQHFCCYEKGATPNADSDSIRIHGYARPNGYFVVTKLDWFHDVH